MSRLISRGYTLQFASLTGGNTPVIPGTVLRGVEKDWGNETILDLSVFPSQTFIYLGVELNSASRARLLRQRVEELQLSSGVSQTRTALSVTQLLGIGVS